MSAPIPEMTDSSRSSKTVWLLVALAFLVGALLRGRWIGHLLMWDEAMEIGAVRSWASGGADFTTSWLWRHPALYCLLMRLCSPLTLGFAERVEWMNIGIYGLTTLSMFVLNRRFLSGRIALMSCGLLAVLPGSVFFDMWLKRDQPIAALCMLGLVAVGMRQMVLAGCLMGVAVLFKEPATFYVVAAVLMILVHDREQGRWRRLGTFLLTCGITFGWWYLIMLPYVDSAVDASSGWLTVVRDAVTLHIRWAATNQATWHHDGGYYFKQLWVDVGPVLLILSGLAVPVMLSKAIHIVKRTGVKIPATWPIWVLVPSYVGLSFLPSKVSWIVICLMPAWATLAAVGVDRCLVAVVGRLQEQTGARQLCLVGLPVALMGVVSLQSLSVTYEQAFQSRDEGQVVCAEHSRQAALMLNRYVKDSDRVLLSSFFHWAGLPSGYPCPIFAHYLEKRLEVVMCDYRDDTTAVVTLVRKWHPDWALLSPVEGVAKDDMLAGMKREFGLCPVSRSTTALLYDLRGVPR